MVRNFTAAEIHLLKNIWIGQFGSAAVDSLYMSMTAGGIPQPRYSGPCIFDLIKLALINAITELIFTLHDY